MRILGGVINGPLRGDGSMQLRTVGKTFDYTEKWLQALVLFFDLERRYFDPEQTGRKTANEPNCASMQMASILAT